VNRNVDFIDQKGFFFFYALLILFFRLLFGVFYHVLIPKFVPFTWTSINILHSIVSFFIVHWVRGTPYSTTYEQGKYDNDTFWEQIDGGVQWTKTRKIFILIPVVVFLLAAYEIEWETHKGALLINAIALGMGIVPKLPLLHHVRLFGINKD